MKVTPFPSTSIANPPTASLRANKRLRVGDLAPPIRATSVHGSEVIVPGGWKGLTHVQFLRFAGCPVCNLHLQQFIKRNGELRDAGIREVVLFHSDANFIDDYYGELPFAMIADGRREIYAQYRIEKSPWAILSPGAWPGLVKGYRLKKAGRIDSTTFGLPADFLIDPSGQIVNCSYGAHSSDQWSVDDVLTLVRDTSAPLISIGRDVSEPLHVPQFSSEKCETAKSRGSKG